MSSEEKEKRNIERLLKEDNQQKEQKQKNAGVVKASQKDWVDKRFNLLKKFDDAVGNLQGRILKKMGIDDE